MERRATRTRTTLAVMLALTLIAPWALGQDLTETRRLAETTPMLGVMYANGRTRPMRWFRLAAEGERLCPIAGVMYANGEGRPLGARRCRSRALVRLAAEQGYASAQYNLGVMYANGRGILKDEELAVRW